MNIKDFYEDIIKTIIQETKYSRFYDGVVVELREGKAVCTINSLGWDTPEKGAICTYPDKNKMTDLKIDDNVIIGFRNNDPARAFIAGIGNDFNLQAPASYDFNTKIETIYDDRSEARNVVITKDNTNKELKVLTLAGWKIIINDGLNVIETTDTGTSITDKNGNKLVSSPTGWAINTGVESFVKGTTWQTNWTTFNSTVQTATPGNEAQNAAAITVIKGAFATFAAQLVNMLSTTIKGE